MSIIDYFSTNPGKRARFIFNFIAPIYKRVDFENSTHYKNSIEYVHQEINLEGKTVLDVGTGIGDWANMYCKYPVKQIVGVDFAQNMIDAGVIKFPEIDFQLGDAENLHQFEDNSFDVVTASFVLHGVTIKYRKKILSEMRRISKQHIVLHDFVGPTPFIIQIIEYFERSDYKFFKQNICIELKRLVGTCKIQAINKGTGIYIASKTELP